MAKALAPIALLGVLIVAAPGASARTAGTLQLSHAVLAGGVNQVECPPGTDPSTACFQTSGTGVVPGTFSMSAQCNRVAVEDGHTESVSVRLKKKTTPEAIIAAWNTYTAEPQKLRLPSAPDQPVVYVEANDRPQPRFDAERGAGMTTTVGRLRPCKVLDWKFTVLSHNTIRGAAGAALLNAELLKAQGYLG